jgi:hypothetical protein
MGAAEPLATRLERRKRGQVNGLLRQTEQPARRTAAPPLAIVTYAQ